MKKLFLIIAVAAFMVACGAPNPQPIVDTSEDDIVAVDQATDEEMVAEQSEVHSTAALEEEIPDAGEIVKVKPLKEEPKSNEQTAVTVKDKNRR